MHNSALHERVSARPGRLIRRVTTVFAIAVGLPMLASASQPGVTEPASITGKWYGTVGFPYDVVEIGFEIRRTASGELKAYLYQPVMNFYGLEVPGTLDWHAESGQYRNADYLLNLGLSSDQQQLTGTYFSLKAPIQLQRSTQLPAEQPLPTIPQGPGPRWQTVLGGAIYAPVAVQDNTVFVGSSTGSFSALDASTGAFKWTFAAGKPIHGAATLSTGQVSFVSDNGYLFALDSATGAEKWRYDLGDASSSRMLPHQVVSNSGEFDFVVTAPKPIERDGTLYVGAGDGGVHAVTAATGKALWRFAGTGSIRTDALVTADSVYVGSLDGQFFALERATGKERWRKDTRAALTSSPALVDGKLIIGNRGGLLAALNPADGSVLWRMTMWGSAVESDPVAGAGSTFYIGSSDLRRVSAIDAADQKVLWRTDVYGWAWPRPAVTDTTVFASAIGVQPYEIRHFGGLHALDRRTGALRWRWPAPPAPGSYISGLAAAPVVVGKMLYVGGLNGTLYAFPVD